METEEWSLDQCKDFLHRSWLSTFSSKHVDYFPFGNTEATDFLHDLDVQASQVDLLMLGAGDIRSLLRTVSGLENKEHSKQRVKKMHVLLNDIDADIVARDVLLLHIIHTLDVNQEEDFHFLWNVWYNLELPERHRQRLNISISRLIEDFGEDSVVSFFNQSTREAVEKSFHQWQQCTVTVHEAKRSRMEALDQIQQDFEDVLDYLRPAYDQLPTHEKKIDLLASHVLLNIQPYWTIEETRGANLMLHSYLKSGSADPYFGIPGAQWPADRYDWKVNPTLLKANTTEYLTDITGSPYASYTPFQKSHYEDHPHLNEACFSLLKERVCIYRRLLDSRKLDLHIELCCDDAALLMTSDALGDRKFDFIDTSSLADDTSLLALLLLCQPKLREARSVLRVESILWRHDHDTIEEYLQHELMGLDPLFFPTILGLRLAESFQYGRRDMPTLSQTTAHKSESFCYCEPLIWVKAACADASPINIQEGEGICTYLVGLARRVFKDTSSDRRPQDPFVLFKLLQRIAPHVLGGMERLLQLVEPMVTGESELMYQWQVYRAVYGYATVPDQLQLVDIIEVNEQLPSNLSAQSSLLCDVGGSTPQRFQNVLFSTSDNNNRRVEVIMLKSHQNAIKQVLPRSVSTDQDHQSQIPGEAKFTTKHHTDVTVSGSSLDPTSPTKEQMYSIREDVCKYIVTLEKGLVINKAACKIANDNTLAITTTRAKKELRVLFSCSIDDVSITTRDELCHVTVIKKKEAILGEHILSFCTIQLNKLRPLGADIDLIVAQYQLVAAIFPLEYDREIHTLLVNEQEKSLQLVGKEVLLDVRLMLLTIVTLSGDVLILGPNSLVLKLKDVFWYNNTILRKIEVINSSRNDTPGQIIRTIECVNKETLLLLVDLLRYNGQRVAQRGTAPGRYASFLQIHYPRANINGQRIREEQKLQGIEDDDFCRNCRKTDSRKQCAACLCVKYCSKECQKLHYRRHKADCKRLAASKPAAVPKPSLCPSCQIKKTSIANVCSRCRKTEYCSMKCRYAHWPNHQKNCQEMSKEAQEGKDSSNDNGARTSTTSVSGTTTSSTTPGSSKASSSSAAIPGASTQVPSKKSSSSVGTSDKQSKLLTDGHSSTAPPSSPSTGSPKASSSSTQASNAATPSTTKVPSKISSSSVGTSDKQSSLPTDCHSSTAPPPPPSTKISCAWCDKPVSAESMRECSKCHESVYCSERCEHAHWPEHWQRCIELSLANVASCAACKHTLTRCHKCKKVWYCACGECKDQMKEHKC